MHAALVSRSQSTPAGMHAIQHFRAPRRFCLSGDWVYTSVWHCDAQGALGAELPTYMSALEPMLRHVSARGSHMLACMLCKL